MKKMKKVVAILLAMVMIIGLCACSSGGGETAAKTSKFQEVMDRGYLIVGTGSTNAPWHFYNEH